MIGKASFRHLKKSAQAAVSRGIGASRSGRLSRTRVHTSSSLRRLPPPTHQRAALSSARPLSYEDIQEDWEPQETRYAPTSSSSPLQQPVMPSRTSELASPAETEEEIPSSDISPAMLSYAADTDDIPITSMLHIVRPGEDIPRGIWPAFRLMDQNGHFRDPAYDGYSSHSPQAAQYHHDIQDLDGLRPFLAQAYPYQAQEIHASGLLHPHEKVFQDTQSTNTLLRAHRQMIRLRQMDEILLAAQRQGRISFYMACTGEEAIHMGSGSALEMGDPIFAQYREQGLLMWRGFTLEQFTNQCFSNNMDLGKGRQMPVHYGSKELNYHTVSSPLGTQLPQAVGAAYRLKLTGQENAVVCFFGDGCASTTDFHSAMNFAATLQVPVVFVCRNNGYAISTPSSDQYAGDGIISRAVGYGMAALRVDGNDVFAMHAAVREARAYAIQHSRPVLLEAMTYRQASHSTSDDSSQYRDTAEVQDCAENHDPIARLEAFLEHQGWMTQEESAAIGNEERRHVLQAMEQAEARPKPPLVDLFTDVYEKLTPELRRQKAQLEAHISKYPDKY